jgi:hypothetical protein
MVSFLTVSQNQSKSNLPVQGNDGVLFSKKVRKKTFIFWACYSKNIMCVFYGNNPDQINVSVINKNVNILKQNLTLKQNRGLKHSLNLKES